MSLSVLSVTSIAVCLCTIGTKATAQELSGTALRELALSGTWQADHAEYGYWRWGEDASLCLSLEGPEGDCADSGTWTVDNNVMCYALTWWGSSVGENEGCFTVQPIENGRYETLFHGGVMVSRMFAFDVVK